MRMLTLTLVVLSLMAVDAEARWHWPWETGYWHHVTKKHGVQKGAHARSRASTGAVVIPDCKEILEAIHTLSKDKLTKTIARASKAQREIILRCTAAEEKRNEQPR